MPEQVQDCPKVARMRELIQGYVQQGFLPDSQYVKEEVCRVTRGSAASVEMIYRFASSDNPGCDRIQYRDAVCHTCWLATQPPRRSKSSDSYDRKTDLKSRQSHSREYHFRLRVKRLFEAELVEQPNLNPQARETLYNQIARDVRKQHREFRNTVARNRLEMTRPLTLDGCTKTLQDWAAENQLRDATVRARLRKGIPDYIAVRDLPDWIIRLYRSDNTDNEVSRMRREILNRPSLRDAIIMTAKERKVMQMLYGDKLSISDASDLLGISKQDLAQTEGRVLRKIFQKYPLEVTLKKPPRGSILPA